MDLDDEITNETGGLSDRDERDGDERRFAKESPMKGKLRLTSRVCVMYSMYLFQWLTPLRHLSRSRTRTTRRNPAPTLQTATFCVILQLVTSGPRRSY